MHTLITHALAALLELGALCGALAAGFFAHRMSRRASISWSCGESVTLLSLRVSLY